MTRHRASESMLLGAALRNMFLVCFEPLTRIACGMARCVRASRVAATLLALLALVTCAQLHAQVSIQYVYDELGRLRSVTDASGATAEYAYDALGNITQIRRTGAGLPAVTEFTPDAGPVGTAVTIQGANFGATPGLNTVKFNGVTASVSSATTSKLVATVPAGATTGPISVQTGAGTGSSLNDFTVGAGAVGAPTITNFASGVGPLQQIVVSTLCV